MKQTRILYASMFLLLLVTEVCIALFIDNVFIRSYVGDMLVTLLLCCLCRVVVPQKARLLPLLVFLFATLVEIGQHFDFVALLGFADNRFLSVLLGRTFSWLDVGCYAVGCIVALALDQLLRRKATSNRT